MTIPGDMYVAQGLYIAPNVTLKVNGALRVGGTIVYGQGATLDAPGYVQGVNYDEDVNNDIRFPAGMSREDITGYELVGYDNNGNIQLKTAEADKVTAKNVVPTREYIRSLFYTDNSHYPDTPFVKNSVQKPPVDFEKGGFSEYVSDDLKKTRTLSGQEQSALASNVLDKDLLTDSKYSFATKTITDSCTISGNIEGGTFIYINPTEDEIWINLINVTFESSVTIIYQDNKYDDAGNFIGKKKINFFVPTNSHMLDEYDYDSEANKNSEYVAKYYDQMNGKITFKNLTIMPRAYYQSNKWDLYTLMDDHMEFYPNATLYMAQMFTPAGKTAVRESDKKTVDVYDIYIDITGNGQKITFQDQSTIIMHIIAPSATFQLANTNSLNKTITYNGEAASNAQTVCGSVNIGYSMQLQNKFSMLAMSLGKSGGDPGPGAEDKNYSWTPINGHALYE